MILMADNSTDSYDESASNLTMIPEVICGILLSMVGWTVNAMFVSYNGGR